MNAGLNAEPLDIKGTLVSGAEHHVWLDSARQLVHKVPSRFGKLWQGDDVERDLRVLREKKEMSLVPTEVIRNIIIQVVGRIRQWVSYVLRQPLTFPSHPMSFVDLLRYKKHQETLFAAVNAGVEMREDHHLGLDLLGAKAVKMLVPALDPRVKAMHGEISNLLVADGDIIASDNWNDFGVRTGDIIAREGDVMNCDPRCYDLNPPKGVRQRILHPILSRIQDVQDTVLWSLLERFEYKVEFDFLKTYIREWVHNLMKNIAIPKMEAYAEAYTLRWI